MKTRRAPYSRWTRSLMSSLAPSAASSDPPDIATEGPSHQCSTLRTLRRNVRNVGNPDRGSFIFHVQCEMKKLSSPCLCCAFCDFGCLRMDKFELWPVVLFLVEDRAPVPHAYRP